MKLVLMIRRTWGYYKDGTIDLRGIVGSEQRSLATEAIEGWDLAIPYLQFRSRLRDIAEGSWLSNRFDRRVMWSNQKAVKFLRPGTWLLPMDEDDWLAPGAATAIRRAMTEEQNLITWKVHRTAADGTVVSKEFIESCGYAVRLPCPWTIITNHMVAAGDAGCRIDEVLAVRNETVASVAYLANRADRKAVIAKALRADFHDPPWAREQRDEYVALLQKSLSSRRIYEPRTDAQA